MEVRRQKKVVKPVKSDLSFVLKKANPGQWVVLNSARSEVIAVSRSASAALAKARKSGQSGYLLLKVPDPNTVCIY